MEFKKYGDRDSITGWEIDHILALANGGRSNIENLQPLNWRNNNLKSDTKDWKCLRLLPKKSGI